MAFLIDSDWLIDYVTDRPEAGQILEGLAPEEIAVSIISYMEVYEGIERDPDSRAFAAKFETLLQRIPLVLVSPQVARRCARIRHNLRTQGRRVNQRALDLLVAATALEHNLTLVTRNVNDYRDIPGIQIYTGTESG